MPVAGSGGNNSKLVIVTTYESSTGIDLDFTLLASEKKICIFNFLFIPLYSSLTAEITFE
jgi:hypothetical protein